MCIRKILGSVVIGHVNHSIAKLENNRYAVGRLVIGQSVDRDAQFETLDTAFEHWLAVLSARVVRKNIVNGIHD